MTDKPFPELDRVLEHARAFRAAASERKHRPDQKYAEALTRFGGPTPEHGAPNDDVIAELIKLAEPGLAAMIGPRFFGWVIGGAHPVGVAADWLTAAWGQNSANPFATPAAAAAETASAAWLLDLMDLPRHSAVGFVTGGSIANYVGLAAARGEVLRRCGWDVEADGLFGAPPITVILGAEAHATVYQSLKYLGLGDRRVTAIPIDDQGRAKPEAFLSALERATGPIIAILQAGHINSGAFDAFSEIIPAAKAKDAWVHVDGAFGLWARANAKTRSRAEGVELADSWAVDGHKVLQTPYDCGYVIVRDADAHRRAMAMTASYLPLAEGDRIPSDFVPELSRRGRGFATWAILRALGRDGVARMVEHLCVMAVRMGERLSTEPGVSILNNIAFNQVAVRLGSDLEPSVADTLTERTIARIQDEGECFVGGAHWRGVEIVRISVTNAATSAADIDRAAEGIVRAWRIERQAGA